MSSFAFAGDMTSPLNYVYSMFEWLEKEGRVNEKTLNDLATWIQDIIPYYIKQTAMHGNIINYKIDREPFIKAVKHEVYKRTGINLAFYHERN